MLSLTISAPCPRCKEPKTILTLAYIDAGRHVGNDFVRETAFKCNNCERLVIARIQMSTTTDLRAKSGNIELHAGLKLLKLLPEFTTASAPKSVPEKVASQYLDGMANLTQQRWTTAAGCFRNAIDRATKLLWKEARADEDWPDKLAPRIQKLREVLELPGTIGDWAHSVRIVGNEIHDLDDVEEQDARDAVHFAEMFLTYTYTLPHRLDEFRARRKASA